MQVGGSHFDELEILYSFFQHQLWNWNFTVIVIRYAFCI